MALPLGNCAICGAYGPLTFEHIPPESAFNDRRVMLADMQRLLSNQDWQGFENPKGKYKQRGAGDYTLCGKCNNDTGHWYGPQYVKWAYEGMRHLQTIGHAGASLRLPYNIQPLPVLKQIMAMFASACGPSFFSSAPEIRRWVLNPDLPGLSDRFKIYCYFISPKSRSTRQAGITGLVQVGVGSSTFAEIAFPPFGYILCLDSLPNDRGLADISFFRKFRRREFQVIYLNIPIREVNSFFPGDFRTMDEIKKQYLASAEGALKSIPSEVSACLTPAPPTAPTRQRTGTAPPRTPPAAGRRPPA